MAESIVRNESPEAYFKELVDAALQRQRLQPSELTSFYVVNLLTTFVHSDNGLSGARRTTRSETGASHGGGRRDATRRAPVGW